MTSLVFLSPYGASIWSEMLPRLSGAAQTILPDLREDRLSTMAERLLDTLPERAVIVGYCMGGYLAFELHRRAPDRIQGLVLISASAAPDSPAAALARGKRLSSLRAKAGRMTFPDSDYVDHAAEWLLSRGSFECPRTVDRARAILSAVPIARSIRHQEAIRTRPDSRPDLPSIRVPTLVLGGREDRVLPPMRLIEMACAIPGSQVELFDCGHLAPVEAPDAVAEVILNWIAVFEKQVRGGKGRNAGQFTNAARDHLGHLEAGARRRAGAARG